MIDLAFYAPIGFGLRHLVVAPMCNGSHLKNVFVIGAVREQLEWTTNRLEAENMELTTFNKFHNKGFESKPIDELDEFDLVIVEEMHLWQLNKIMPTLETMKAKVWLINPHNPFMNCKRISFSR